METILLVVCSATILALGVWVISMASEAGSIPRGNPHLYPLQRQWHYLFEGKTILRLEQDDRMHLLSRSFHIFGDMAGVARCRRVHEECENWLQTYVGDDRWGYIPFQAFGDYCAIWFSDPDDAVAFKMRWY